MKRAMVLLALTSILTWGYDFAAIRPAPPGPITDIPVLALLLTAAVSAIYAALGAFLTRIIASKTRRRR